MIRQGWQTLEQILGHIARLHLASSTDDCDNIVTDLLTHISQATVLDLLVEVRSELSSTDGPTK